MSVVERPLTCWYVGYGSNLLRTRVLRYLSGFEEPKILSEVPTTVNRRLYFGGHSKTWGGAVAFLHPTIVRPTSYCKAYLMTGEALEAILAQENGRAVLDPQENWWDIPEGSVYLLNVTGKYNQVLRLDDIDGYPAFTVTSSTVQPWGRPPGPYLATIRAGLQECGLEKRTAEGYLEVAAKDPGLG